MQLLVTLGILYVDVVGFFGSWRWLSVACLVFSFVWAAALMLVPESPVYLMRKRRLDDARRALQVSVAIAFKLVTV